MPAVQRTFELVPTSLARPVARPPMTSKAAKKAYQKAQNGPKISRAEQRKRDAEILEKLRKEHEKERAAAKAKAVREKKAAKAAEEREERRRMRLPEPRKGVRASQPTISLFVRGNSGGGANAKRVWREMENVVEDEENAVEEEVVGNVAWPPTKRVATEYEEETTDTDAANTTNLLRDPDGSASSTENKPPADRKSSKHGSQRVRINIEEPVKPPRLSTTMDPDSEDDFGDFPSLTQTDILKKLDSSLCSPREMPPPPIFSQRNFDKGRDVHTHKPLPKPPDQKEMLVEGKFKNSVVSSPHFRAADPTLPNVEVVPHEDEFDDTMASTQFFQEAIAVVSKMENRKNRLINEVHAKDLGLTSVVTRSESPVEPPKRIKLEKNGTSSIDYMQSIWGGKATSERERTATKPVSLARRSVMEERSINMPPPKPPLNIVKPTAFPSPGLQARFAPQASRLATPTRPPFTPKPNFVVNRKKITSMAPPPRRPRFLPANHRKDAKILSDAPPSATQTFLENNLEDFYPTPTQEKRELDEIMDDAESLPSNTQIAREISPSKPALNPQLIKYDDFQFPSTQDFMISSQDLFEINSPQSTPINVPKVALETPVSRPVSRGKPRFFDEKEEDLLQAGLLGAKEPTKPRGGERIAAVAQVITLSPETPSIQAAIAESKKLAEIRRLADATFDNFDDGFNSLSQAIRESEKTSQPTAKASEEDMEAIEAAIVESKRIADLESQQSELGLGSRRFFQEKEEDLVEAALWESKRILEAPKDPKLLHDQAPVTRQPAKVQRDAPLPTHKEKRTLKRAESGLTDYGGDDGLISSQELLAFCDVFDA